MNDQLDDSSSDALAELIATIRELKTENEQLRERVRTLECQVAPQSLEDPGPDRALRPDDEISADSPAEAKLDLFQSLFRGRDDVYAIRWERPSGRSGYAPALRPGVPRARGIKHEPDDYLPLVPEVLRSHLTGHSTVGIYPLLRDETCWLLAIDFDKEGWQKDALAAQDACDSLGVTTALERSRFGHRAHLRMLQKRIIGYKEIGYFVRFGSERGVLSPEAE